MTKLSLQGFVVGTIFLSIFSIIAFLLYNSFTSGSIASINPIFFWFITSGIVFGLYFVFKGVASSQTGLNLNSTLIPLAVIALLIYFLIKNPQVIPQFSIAAQRATGGILPLFVPITSLARVRAIRRIL